MTAHRIEALRGAGREERAGSGAQRGPRAVTRGESPAKAERVKVDWLNATFAEPGMTVQGFIDFLGKLFGRPTGGQERGGLLGFAHRVAIRVYVDGAISEVGSIAYGGDAQRGRWLLQLTGRGCGLVTDWSALQDLLEGLNATLTRLDLAADFMTGEYTLEDAVSMHRDGGFTTTGRPPSTALAGDWLDGVRGRTLYVGRASNGKMLRVYEKGKELGDFGSPWVRFEVQLGNRDRVIPLDALTECESIFAGAYPALAQMVEQAAERIPTTQTEGETTLAHLLHHAKRCYGKLINTLLSVSGVSHTDLVEEVRVIGFPRRVKPSAVVGGLEWPEIQARTKRH